MVALIQEALHVVGDDNVLTVLQHALVQSSVLVQVPWEAVARRPMLAAVLRDGVVSSDAAPGGVEVAVVVVVVIGGGGGFVLEAAHVWRYREGLHHVEAVEPLQAPQGLKVRVLHTAGIAGAAVLAAWDLTGERCAARCVGASVGGVGVVVIAFVVVVVAGIIILSCSKIPTQRKSDCYQCHKSH